tara:strand:+ start:329 stop:511 length:183 start_codon:yes stop_codon:yes gene_type:complete
MKNKITKLKNIIEDLDLITMDCFDNSYPSYINNSLSTSLSIIKDTADELKKYESKKELNR